MSLILFIVAIMFASLVIAAIKSKGKVKKMITFVVILSILVPATFLVLVRPAQQGKILPEWGKISLLLFEPGDLWEPLAEEPLNSNKLQYEFSFSHKYVGNHNIAIILLDKEEIDLWKIDRNDLKISVKFYRNSELLFSKSTTDVNAFKGLRGNGLTYIAYAVSDDVPISQKLDVVINVMGNMDDFLNKYGNAKIIIRKGSDL